ncbi:hypothetical protein [Limihaloglobus sulfuriphilus]|nr:hypothetical protein [Limihaloglobus sulfuriphilus]
MMTRGPYGFLWWEDGFSNLKPLGSRELNIQTSSYGLSFNVETADITRFGRIKTDFRADDVPGQGNRIVQKLEESELNMELKIDGRLYTCKGGVDFTSQIEYKKIPYRLINTGRYVQRYDLLGILFEDSDGNPAPADVRLELLSWPDSLTLVLDAEAESEFENFEMSLKLKGSGKVWLEADKTFENVKRADSCKVFSTWSADTESESVEEHIEVSAKAKESLSAGFEKQQDCFVIDIPSDFFYVGKPHQSVESCDVFIRNDSEKKLPVKLFFRMEYEPGQGASVIGTAPILCYADGRPTGDFVQISKNWHRPDDGEYPEYVDNWFYAYTIVEMPAKSCSQFKYKTVNGFLDGVPIVSHSQLCLLGWGGNQLWEQVAIGNWGEAICYDPDIGLNRSFIDDVRPLMVWSMGDEDRIKWGWTNNVGGGNFLQYYDQSGQEQKLVSVKTLHRVNGPNWTEAVYSGITRDGAIKAEITVSTPRCEDYNRSRHRFRYEVLKPVNFSRLAFYQMGADNYNTSVFDLMARGSADGLVEEWKPEMGGKKYHRKSIACKGDLPWFSIHKTTDCNSFRERKGALANRGLIVRDYSARINGTDYNYPFMSNFGVENGSPSSNVELSAPEGVSTLKPGDFVECSLDFIVLPKKADDYYGTNETLKAYLEKYEDTWRPVYREAVLNDLKVQMHSGILVENYPLVVCVDEEQKAEFTVTGGAGYVPVIFADVTSGRGFRLVEITEGKQVDIHDNINYQLDKTCSDTYRVTYNISLDPDNGKSHARRLKFTVK